MATDNFYSSIRLAEKLISRKTHLVGTLRRNRKGIPLKVKEKPLKRGQVYSQQNRSGVLVLKWKTKRDLFMVSTRHDDSLAPNGKPMVVEDYNKLKGFVDLSDQMSAYSPFLRKTSKWYVRLFFHLMTQTALINAWTLYNEVVKKVKFNDFKMDVVEALIADNSPRNVSNNNHKLEQVPGPKAATRRRCLNCYKRLSEEFGRTHASRHSKLVNTRCNKCLGYYCLECFQRFHKKCVP